MDEDKEHPVESWIKKKTEIRIIDDKMFEDLMRYYKLDNPDILQKYIKSRHPIGEYSTEQD